MVCPRGRSPPLPECNLVKDSDHSRAYTSLRAVQTEWIDFIISRVLLSMDTTKCGIVSPVAVASMKFRPHDVTSMSWEFSMNSNSTHSLRHSSHITNDSPLQSRISKILSLSVYDVALLFVGLTNNTSTTSFHCGSRCPLRAGRYCHPNTAKAKLIPACTLGSTIYHGIVLCSWNVYIRNFYFL
jgi:hypothetical protein